ncbi:MAG: galactose mutarotase [Kiritimatiellae bacterium]|nr:galactose mutarotase [Kiritimatiellia bacterium]
MNKPSMHVLRTRSGLSLGASSLGGIVTSLRVPGPDGRPHEVLLACPKPEMHHDNGYMNAIIGRVGNRISGGGFELDGVRHALALNSGTGRTKCTLHGGERGFDRKVWDVREYAAPEGPALEFTTLSPDGEEGFPGNLFVRVVYTLCESGAWRIDYLAQTDAPTVVNLTQHAYFNLSGGERDAKGHAIMVNASRFTEVGPGLVPTGRSPSVEGTALDLRAGATLGDVLKKTRKDPNLKVAGGIDHNYVLDREAPGLAFAAYFADPVSGIDMEVHTTEPGVQVYTGNFLAGAPARGGGTYSKHHAVCFETQHFPDSPNQAGFPSIRLEPGETYRSTTVYKFGLADSGCDCCGDGGCDCGK